MCSRQPQMASAITARTHSSDDLNSPIIPSFGINYSPVSKYNDGGCQGVIFPLYRRPLPPVAIMVVRFLKHNSAPTTRVDRLRVSTCPASSNGHLKQYFVTGIHVDGEMRSPHQVSQVAGACPLGFDIEVNTPSTVVGGRNWLIYELYFPSTFARSGTAPKEWDRTRKCFFLNLRPSTL